MATLNILFQVRCLLQAYTRQTKNLTTCIRSLHKKDHLKPKTTQPPVVPGLTEDKLKNMSPFELVQSCHGAVLARVDASKLLNRADVVLRSRLSELEANSLQKLAVALARSRTFLYGKTESKEDEVKKSRIHPLMLALRDQFENRLTDFSTPAVIDMLMRFGFAKVDVSRDALREIEERVKQSLFQLSDIQLSQFVSALSAQDYFTQQLPLREELHIRADAMDHRSMSQIFHYIAQSGIADKELVAKILSVLKCRVATFPFVSVVRLVTGLLHGDVTEYEEARLIGELVAERVSKSNIRHIHPTDCCYLLGALLALEACSEELLHSLMGNSLRLGHLLRPREICLLVFTLSTVRGPSVRSLCERLLFSAQHLSINGSTHLTMKDVRLICNGIRRLRFCLSVWLEPIERFALHNYKDLVRYKNGKDMIFIATVLSFLNYPAKALFNRLVMAFDCDDDESLFDVPPGLKCRLLWACIVQNSFPSRSLAALMKINPEEVDGMTTEERKWLQQVNALVGAHKGRASCLKPPPLQRLLELLENQDLADDSAAGMCFKELGDSLSEGILHRNVRTSEGCYVAGTFLLEYGKPIAWSESTISAASQSARQLRLSCLQPVAIVPTLEVQYSLPAGRRLGTNLMQLRTLKACGWDVLEVPVAEWAPASDKAEFLQAQDIIVYNSREKEEPLDDDFAED